MFAVSQGMYANYVDENVIPLATFLGKGIKHGLQKQNRTALSEFIRGSEDITFYRHYHGPLYFYGLIISAYFMGDDEYSARWTSLLILIVSVAVLYAGCFFLLKENARVSAMIASVLLMSSPSNIVTAARITPHGMHVLTVIITLFLMAKLLQTNELRYWYWSVVGVALSFTVIEYALLLMFTLLACVLVQRRQLFPNSSKQEYGKFMAVSALLFVGMTFIVWPGAWLKLSLIKNYIFHTYFALIRGAEYGTMTFGQVWWTRLSNSPLEYMLIIPATIAAIMNVKRIRWYLPFLIYALLLLITTFRNTSLSPRFISSLLPPLYVVSGIIIAQRLSKSSLLMKTSVTAIIVFVLFGFTYFHFIPLEQKSVSYTPLREVVGYFRANHFEDKDVLVDRNLLPTLHYYFRHKSFSSYSEKADDLSSMLEKLRASAYDGILYAGNNQRDFEDRLRSYLVLQPEIITTDSSSNQQIIYYKIQKTG